MGKIVDGIELLRMIRDREIEERNTIIKKKSGVIYIYKDEIIKLDEVLPFYTKGTSIFDICSIKIFLYDEFEILSEDEKIDIDSIEEIDLFDNGIGFDDIGTVKQSYDRNFEKITDKYNELIKAVKQLNNQMKREE